MKLQGKFILFILSFLVLCKVGISQNNFASNVTSSVSGDEKLLITYDIKNPGNSKSFNVIVMLTYEGSQINASSVYGDIGSNIKPGNEKAIVWYFKNDFDGNIENINIDVFAYKENEPQAIFKIVSSSNNNYAPCQIVFENNSSYANEYQWDFGDPNSGSLNYSFKKEPAHIFKTGGIYSIALIARNTKLQLENTYYQSIEIKTHEKTTADFVIDGNNQLPPAKVTFINKSINADVYYWDFGDPASKRKNELNDKNAKHKYKNAGTYTVRLVVKNNFSRLSDTITKEVVLEQIVVPDAKFVFNKSAEVAPSTVVFKNMSTSGNRYKWDFGDPASGSKNTSDENNPAHTYTKSGSYEVVLLTYGKGEKKPSKFTETVKIKKLPNPPKSKFSITNNNVLGPATIVFANNSKNATSYNWDFGDQNSGNNNTSDKANPTHTYKNAGTYKVVLTATTENFIEKSVFTDNVIITSPANPPVARFEISNNNATAPVTVGFNNQSENADKYIWNFGDLADSKNNSSEQTPTHRYTKAGRYKVVLTVTNNETGEQSIFSDFVIISEPAKPKVKPVAKFSPEKTNYTSPAIVSFTNNSIDANSYLWDFGDPDSEENNSVVKHPTHIYSTPGRYMVELTVTNDISGERGIITSFINVTKPAKPAIRPIAKWNIKNGDKEAPATISFSDNSTDADSYEWDFGDAESADNISTEINPTHIFKTPGRYKIRVTVTNNSSGLTNSFSDFITISAPVKLPIANFEIENNNTLQPATVIFNNSSENANSYAWDFGDSNSGNQNTSTLENPQHIYEKAGTYKVVLAVLNKETSKENIIEKTVVVTKPIDPPVANFEVTFNGEFAPINIEFKNLSENADTYSWNFGDFDSDKNNSIDKIPLHYYKQPGSYRVTLEAKNSITGKIHKISKEVTLKSSFPTFTKTNELPGNNENAVSIANTSNNELLIVLNNSNNKSTIIKLNNEGSIVDSENFNYQLFEIATKDKNKNFTMLGKNSSGKLFVQSINRNLKIGKQIPLTKNKEFKLDFATPKLAFSTTNEIGIIANILNEKYPINLFFEKMDKNGKPISLSDRTFKYIGTKLVTDFVATENGGFALTGYWQKDSGALKEILYSRIDKTGRGEIHLIGANVNSLGLDIEESYQNGFALLRAKEDFDNKEMYEISFILINKDGSPTDCATALPCKIEKKDILKYRPSLIKTEDGYLIATHAFDGVGYNISLFWFDKSGGILTKQEEINIPNSQFVMDVVQTSDGGLLIVGAENRDKRLTAIVLKTDSLGKIYK